MVRFTSGIREHRPHVARVPQGVVLVLIAEVTERRVDDPAGRVAEAAKAAPVLQPVRDPLEDAELDLRSFVGEDALIGAHSPVAANTTRRALAARLVRI